MPSKSYREQCHSAATSVNSAPDPLAITEILDDLAGAFEDVAIDVLVYRITDLDHPVVVYWGEIPLRYFLSLFRDANTKLPYIFQRLLGLEDYVGGFPSYAHGARSLMEIVAVRQAEESGA